MLTIERTCVEGWEAAVRGMRNPMNSWNKSDSHYLDNKYILGKRDKDLMMKLAKAGDVDGKFLRMITVTADITAPLYWWKEYDTYKVGTVANSCSTMHKIHEKEFTWDDFSTDHLLRVHECFLGDIGPTLVLQNVINALNCYRSKFLKTCDKRYWWQMIQLLPSSYNQKRTVFLNYSVLRNIYKYRRNHKLDEWRAFCGWIEMLPYEELITETF